MVACVKWLIFYFQDVKVKQNQNFIIPVLGLCLCSPLYAYDSQDDVEIVEERQRDAYAAKGSRLGTFLFYPKMTLDNEYDSNIFKRDSRVGEVDSYIAHFKPGFSINSDWNRHSLYFSLDTDLALYSSQADANNYNDVFVGLGGQFDVLKDSAFDASFNYDKLHEDRGSPDQRGGSTPTFYDNKTLALAYSHKFNRLSVKPAFQFSRLDYEDTPTALGVDLRQSTRSRWEFLTSIRMGYEIQPEYEAFVKFAWKEINYDTEVLNGFSPEGYLRDSTGYNALVGMDFDLTELLTGDVSVGYLYRGYEDSRLETISDVNGFINLTWRPTPLTSVLFKFSRDIGETTQNGVSGVIHNSPSINVTHELLRNVILNVGGSYSYNQYIGFNPNNQVIANRTEREEDVYGVNLGIKYLLNRHLNVEFTYGYESRHTNYILQDYNVHHVMFNITGQI